MILRDSHYSSQTDASVFTPSNTVALNGTVHEIVPSEIDPIISWNQIGGNSVNLQNTDTLNPTFNATSVGQYTFRLTATVGDTTIEDEVTVKRLHKTAKKHLVELLPENPDYQPIKVDLRESEFQIEGLSVGVLRRGN